MVLLLLLIKNNIGCIEIADVDRRRRTLIKNNIGCIEIFQKLKGSGKKQPIKNNIGCIEIRT